MSAGSSDKQARGILKFEAEKHEGKGSSKEEVLIAILCYWVQTCCPISDGCWNSAKVFQTTEKA